MKFIIVIPAKNEEKNIQLTLDSIINQEKRPEICLVVDDHSLDATPRIVNKMSQKYPFIECHRINSNDKTYQLGGKVVQSFHFAHEIIERRNIDYDYIIKMDADIRFNSNFFHEIEKRLMKEEFGIVSGTPYQIIKEKKKYITSPVWHTNGDFKIYNRKCLEAIEGLNTNLGWDCADNIAAIEKGWKTKAFRDIYYEQQRPIGKYSSLEGRVRQGKGAYILRYSFIYLIIRIIHDIFRKPLIIGSVYFFYGYLHACYYKTNRVVTKSQGRILRNLLWQSFFERIRNRKFFIFQILKKEESTRLNYKELN